MRDCISKVFSSGLMRFCCNLVFVNLQAVFLLLVFDGVFNLPNVDYDSCLLYVIVAYMCRNFDMTD